MFSLCMMRSKSRFFEDFPYFALAIFVENFTMSPYGFLVSYMVVVVVN